MNFWKINGAGNDFIILNNMQEHIPQDRFPGIARLLCERHRSIGADGLMIVEPPQGDADFRMLFYNSDGTLGEMCGNGVRSLCRYGYETGLAGEVQRVETTAGLITGWRIDRRMYQIRLNRPTVVRLDLTLDVDGETIPCSYVELGDPGIPHAVVPISGLRDYPAQELFQLGRKLRYHPAFPKGANINFYELMGPDQIYERTYERGVEDFTYACGTGTGSVVTVLTLQGKVSGKNVRVDMTGGRLTIDAEYQDGQVSALFLTGPTNVVARGEVLDEELIL